MDDELGKIPLDQCVKGRVYKIRCRNLLCGVYNGDGGFIGIREKFGDEYLFTEYHWDQGGPFGTVSGQKDTGIDLPTEIELRESLGPVDQNSSRPLVWDKGLANSDYPNGWWKFADNGEVAAEYEQIRPMEKSNAALFKFLQGIKT